MKSIKFTSSLADEMKRFFELKRVCDTDYFSSAKLLFYFDRHLVRQQFEGKILTASDFQSYFYTIKHLCSRSFANRYSVLRQFSAWLNQRQPLSFVLEYRHTVNRSHSRPAYIFTRGEIELILQSNSSFSEQDEIIADLYATLFSLLYTTGIRIGEACVLNYGDYIGDEKILHIKKGKFRKERYIVLSDSMDRRLNEYFDRYKAVLPLEEDSALFVNKCRKRLTHNNTWLAFIKILDKAGIHKDKNSGPRLHDFRHTFAVV
jgi:integrase/recombinase XerD